MAYNTNILLTDLKGLPIPQYYNPVTDKLEVLMGSNGASRVLLYDQNGNPLLTTANPGMFQIVGSNAVNTTLLNAVSAAGRGLDNPVGGLKTLTFEVFGTASSFNLQIEGKSISGTPIVLQATNLNTLTNSTNITAAGLYQVDVTGLVSVDANLTAVTGGNVTAQGKLVA